MATHEAQAQTANPHEARARSLKAMKLVAAIGGFAARIGATPLEVATLADAHDREVLAQLAGVRAPSDETWTVVVCALREAKYLAEGF